MPKNEVALFGSANSYKQEEQAINSHSKGKLSLYKLDGQSPLVFDVKISEIAGDKVLTSRTINLQDILFIFES